ncbi:MAG: PIG-L family deacetylase [Verrucomicrobia bacterium]|nr:PIG-L family deacetylase [Verrucomicrobiota bacterium]
MKFHQTNAELFIPDGVDQEAALSRVTHLGIGAHQDDLEFMAFHGILACYQSENQWFGGVTCTNGAGSARTGFYEHFTDGQMQEVRREEQKLAARIGQYGAMVQLDFPSSAVKDPLGTALRDDLIEVLHATRPRVVYTHNPADKHDTHIGVALAAIQAMRALPMEQRPEVVHGCELWRNLDWMCDHEKVAHDVGSGDKLAAALNGVFDSQIAGGKRYDLGVLGRRRANATFFESHAIDRADSIGFAMDLTPLVCDESLDVAEYVDGFICRFREDVFNKLKKWPGR